MYRRKNDYSYRIGNWRAFSLFYSFIPKDKAKTFNRTDSIPLSLNVRQE